MPQIKIETIESDGSHKTAFVDTAFGLEFAKAKYAHEHHSCIAITAEYVEDAEKAASHFLHELAGMQYLFARRTM